VTRTSSPLLRVLCALLVVVAVSLFALPLVGMLAAAPWSSLYDLVTSDEAVDALRLSLVSSLGAAALSIVLGLPLAAWLARGSSPLRSAVRVVVTLPVVLPPIVAGIALLLAFGRNGLVGAWLERSFGVSLPFTTAATVVAAAYMGMPFFVLSAEAGLRAADARFDEAARTLGANPTQRFMWITLPMVRPALLTGALLAWARALGEFCATQMFAGNLQGTTRTLPLQCAIAMESAPELAIGLSLVLASTSVLVLWLVRNRLLRSR
jgi:molybdate transport system permease protein